MKKLLTVAVICCLVIGAAAGVSWRQAENNSVVIYEDEMEFENPIYNVDGLTYVPLRELGEKLRIPVGWNEIKKQAELETRNKRILKTEATELVNDQIIPDEATALAMGRAILEGQTGRKMEYKTSYGEYYLNVWDYENLNVWRVSQWVDLNEGGIGVNYDISPTVWLNKNTGEVMYLHLESLEAHVAEHGFDK